MPAVADRPLTLAAMTAADLMRPALAVVRRHATFSEALAFFIDHNLTVAPVVDDDDEPVGVLSLTDLLIHVRACLAADGGGYVEPASADRLMTPTVFSVAETTPAAAVVRDMVQAHVHHLFVTDEPGRIVGVISTCDVLCHLQ